MQTIKDLKPFIEFIDENTVVELKKDPKDLHQLVKLKEIESKNKLDELTTAFIEWSEAISNLGDALTNSEQEKLKGICAFYDYYMKGLSLGSVAMKSDFITEIPGFYKGLDIAPSVLIAFDIKYAKLLMAAMEYDKSREQCSYEYQNNVIYKKC